MKLHFSPSAKSIESAARLVVVVCAVMLAAGVAYAAAQPLTPIGELGQDDVGRRVTVRGVVSDTANFAAGFKFVISDSTGVLAMTLFTRTYDALTSTERLNVGALVTVSGKLSSYKGALELLPYAAKDLDVGALVTPSLAAPPLAQKTGKITAKPGQRVVISGTIARVEPFKLGLKLYVNDGSGARRVTLFNTLLERVPSAQKLVAGQRVQVVGAVSVYRNYAEIAPALPIDVRVLD